MRVAVFLGPVIAFIITKRWCISLQRKDEETLLHGYETGIIMRSPEGGYSERHLPISEARAYTLTARDRDPDVTQLESGSRRQRRGAPRRQPARGHPGRGCRTTDVRRQHAEADQARSSRRATTTPSTSTSSRRRMDGVSADGHQFDGHHLVEDETLRGDH